jgi:hypothetical protein
VFAFARSYNIDQLIKSNNVFRGAFKNPKNLKMMDLFLDFLKEIWDFPDIFGFS